ncbi:MAG: phosphatidylglycerophosphatase A [Candidatus Eisenbacteria bacterium]
MRRSPADSLAVAVGTGIYSGYFPIFPGTVGSAVGIVLYLVLVRLGILAQDFSAAWLVTVGVVFAGGVLSAHRCETLFGQDNKRIVIDEVWGMLIALFMLPVSWWWMLWAFLIFRFLDIVKPFPARRAERMGGGLAIMLDDGIAGAYTVLILQILKAILG